MEEPPRTLPDLIKLFIQFHEKDCLKLQRCIENLCRIIKTFEKGFKDATDSALNAFVSALAGGITMIMGLALAPFSLVYSTTFIGLGACFTAYDGICCGVYNFKKMHQQKKLREATEAELKEFQDRIAPITDVLKNIDQYTMEMLRELNKPLHVPSFFSKPFVTFEFACVMNIDDIADVAEQMSKTAHLTATLSGVFAGIDMVPYFFSVTEDKRAFSDMKKLVNTPIHQQISENQIKSKAGKFILDMRKVILHLQNIMDELKKTKDLLATYWDKPNKTK